MFAEFFLCVFGLNGKKAGGVPTESWNWKKNGFEMIWYRKKTRKHFKGQLLIRVWAHSAFRSTYQRCIQILFTTAPIYTYKEKKWEQQQLQNEKNVWPYAQPMAYNTRDSPLCCHHWLMLYLKFANSNIRTCYIYAV